MVEEDAMEDGGLRADVSHRSCNNALFSVSRDPVFSLRVFDIRFVRLSSQHYTESMPEARLRSRSELSKVWNRQVDLLSVGIMLHLPSPQL